MIGREPASSSSSDISTGENFTSIGASRITKRDGMPSCGRPPAAARAEMSVSVHMKMVSKQIGFGVHGVLMMTYMGDDASVGPLTIKADAVAWIRVGGKENGESVIFSPRDNNSEKRGGAVK